MGRRMNWAAANERDRMHAHGTEILDGSAPAPARPRRKGATLADPVEICKFWKNRRRSDAVHITLSTYEGVNIVDCRVYYTNDQGQMRPSNKGLAMSVAKLPELLDGISRAVMKATELGLLDQEGPGE